MNGGIFQLDVQSISDLLYLKLNSELLSNRNQLMKVSK